MNDKNINKDLKTEYIIKQLGRTKNKKYEMYVVNRIINLINDLDIKFITQQYVVRPEGRALTDLFFPQFNIHIEVDEPHHKQNIQEDKIREADIINATQNHEIIRVDVDNPIESINKSIDEIVEKILRLKKQQQNDDTFISWDIDAEFNTQTYIDRGYIDVNDNVAFYKISDACNCFGHNYKGFQRGGTLHAIDKSKLIWFPKLYKNGQWDNSIHDDEKVIIEKHEKELERKKHVEEHFNQNKPNNRITFARVKDNLGNVLYRFRGEYELNIQKSNPKNGLYWERTHTRVQTIPQMNS